MIVVGPMDEFNKTLASGLKAELVPLDRRIFPDGEACPRVRARDRGHVKGHRVILSLRSGAGKADLNSYLIEVLITLKNLKENLEASRVDLVMPYFPYARQDDVFRLGEPMSAKHVADLLEMCGADSVYCVTTHLHRTKGLAELFDRIDATNISGFPALSLVLELKDLRNPQVIAPDEEALVWAKEVAQYLGISDCVAFSKKRDLDTGEIATTVKEVNVSGRDVVIVDDIVSTGGTMANAISAVRRRGARNVISAFVHPVLAGNAIDRLINAGATEIIATDTLIWEGSTASVAGLISDELAKG